MAKIKITDLPKDTQISREEMKKVFGGIRTQVVGVQLQGRTPTLINRNLMPGDLVTCYECCGQGGACSCDCDDCLPGPIRTR